MFNFSEKKKKINTEAFKTAVGLLSILAGILLFVSFISYYFSWQSDQSELVSVLSKDSKAENLLGSIGAWISELFIYKGIGITAFVVPVACFALGFRLLFGKNLFKPWKFISHSIFSILWIPVLLGFILSQNYIFSGVYGYEFSEYLRVVIGDIGLVGILLISLLLYIVFEFNLTAKNIREKTQKKQQSFSDWKNKVSQSLDESISKEELNADAEEEKLEQKVEGNTVKLSEQEKVEEEEQIFQKPKNTSLSFEINTIKSDDEDDSELLSNFQKKNNLEDFEVVISKGEEEQEQEQEFTRVNYADSELKMSVNTTTESEVGENKSDVNINDLPPYDPRLELPRYEFPHLDLMSKYEQSEGINVSGEELEQNKNKIVETLNNYGIKISHIKATVGPTVTLYEIIPEAGVRISKIKNLEDDIALSLSALGIRIIAPIPGKGTIGIEVPNKNPSVVSMRSVLASPKFQNAKMQLPVAFGKTISNETFVEDLAKMPHLLLAGATGQGKSVGLNAVITSLLYKKHPSELKFVLIDPKKVELTLYNQIERHFLAKLPDSEEAIITDNTKVINTLNSLCIEMDDRYELLKKAMVRNLKEYNEKFIKRKLNPENGHRYLPYIVLVVDEFADLIMTAGKEVELPIARLAQLARAIGIHLIIATQRPSVNVITGTIKANFPGRIAFRVTSKIDSRTILDGSGADQLIGRGDMLFTKGSDMVRLQCAFVDTPEVEKLTEFIGSQKAFPEVYELPEYNSEEGGGSSSFDASERDELFEEAAKVLVTAQQGSTSLIQRKLSLGYNRAGRIMDQLEDASIVGPFEGSKARKVLFADLTSLEQYLSSIR
ncbi:MAG: DNA translocase FtsK [Flavobacteriales bacterium]|nr:DNA translocase FtsK [Flavobacteriales bacterium]